jgi:hypothetical protein
VDTLERLTRAEDAALRRLHYFETAGATLTRSSWAFKESLRARDLRAAVREPLELVLVLADAPNDARPAALPVPADQLVPRQRPSWALLEPATV